jgi:hypothetical protein
MGFLGSKGTCSFEVYSSLGDYNVYGDFLNKSGRLNEELNLQLTLLHKARGVDLKVRIRLRILVTVPLISGVGIFVQ